MRPRTGDCKLKRRTQGVRRLSCQKCPEFSSPCHRSCRTRFPQLRWTSAGRQWQRRNDRRFHRRDPRSSRWWLRCRSWPPARARVAELAVCHLHHPGIAARLALLVPKDKPEVTGGARTRIDGKRKFRNDPGFEMTGSRKNDFDLFHPVHVFDTPSPAGVASEMVTSWPFMGSLGRALLRALRHPPRKPQHSQPCKQRDQNGGTGSKAEFLDQTERTANLCRFFSCRRIGHRSSDEFLE